MELWFAYAIASTIFAGMQTFLVKVASERGHDASLNIFVASIVTSIISWILVAITGVANHDSWKLIALFACISGILYATTCVTRIESLRRIDTTIFFPLYKTIGPAVAVIFGFIIFHERFTWWEGIGIALSIIVPLLLIHRDEHTRQRALVLGLVLMVVSTLCTVSAHVFNKMAADLGENLLLFVAFTQGFAALTALATRFYQTRTLLPKEGEDWSDLIRIATITGIVSLASFFSLLKAFELGTLSIAYTINSLYIIIPILLSVWIYKEHFNVRKGLAVAFSILALVFLH